MRIGRAIESLLKTVPLLCVFSSSLLAQTQTIDALKNQTFLNFKEELIEELEASTGSPFSQLAGSEQRRVIDEITQLYWYQRELLVSRAADQKEAEEQIPAKVDEFYRPTSEFETLKEYLIQAEGLTTEQADEIAPQIVEMFLHGLRYFKGREAAMPKKEFETALEKNELVDRKHEAWGRVELNWIEGKKFIKIVHERPKKDGKLVEDDYSGKMVPEKDQIAIAFMCSDKINPLWHHFHRYIANQHFEGNRQKGRDIAVMWFQNGNEYGFTRFDRIENYKRHPMFSKLWWRDFALATPIGEVNWKSVAVGAGFGLAQGGFIVLADGIAQHVFHLPVETRWMLAFYAAGFSTGMGFLQNFLRKYTNRGSNLSMNLKKMITTGLPYNVPVFLATYPYLGESSRDPQLYPFALGGVLLWLNMFKGIFVSNWTKVWMDRRVKIREKLRLNTQMVKLRIPPLLKDPENVKEEEYIEVEVEKQSNLESRTVSLKTSSIRLLDASGYPVGKWLLIGSYPYQARKTIRYAESVNSDITGFLKRQWEKEKNFFGIGALERLTGTQGGTDFMIDAYVDTIENARSKTSEAFVTTAQKIRLGFRKAREFAGSLLAVGANYLWKKNENNLRQSQTVSECLLDIRDLGLSLMPAPATE